MLSAKSAKSAISPTKEVGFFPGPVLGGFFKSYQIGRVYFGPSQVSGSKKSSIKLIGLKYPIKKVGLINPTILIELKYPTKLIGLILSLETNFLKLIGL